MKLAEALQERADLNTRISELRNRLSNNALVQEGEKPAEDPTELLKQLDDSCARLEELMARINKTNQETKSEGKTITEMIAHRDALKVQVEIYRSLIEEASSNTRRATRTEIKILSTVDVRKLQKKADAISKEIRTTDNKIQELNWTSELL
ncbi:MAG: DIP1984 family protein [Erysipelotrichaceae bacterium]|nr:DIP1984 family protein [Erysipelotrichaceae bacterium]